MHKLIKSAKKAYQTAHSYIVFIGQNCQHQQRAKLHYVCNKNTVYFKHSCLTTHTTPQHEECIQKKAWTWHFCGNGSSPGLNLARTSHGEGHRAKIPFVLSSGPMRESWVNLTLNIPHCWTHHTIGCCT